jgi:AcrR family transcriptional regulator
MLEPGLRERKKQRTRQAIVSAALALFAERGYQQTTVAEIAEAAEVSKGTLFAYFPSKEEIVFADTAPLREDLLRELRERSSGLSALETLRQRVTQHLSEPDERELLRERLIAENEMLRSHYRARMVEVEDAVAAAIAHDLGDAPDGLRPRLAAAAVMAALTVAKEHARCVRGRKASHAEANAVIDEAVAFLGGGLAAISGPRPAQRKRAG